MIRASFSLVALALLFSLAGSLNAQEAAKPENGGSSPPSFLTRERLQIRDPFKRELPKKQRILKKDRFGSTSYTNVFSLEGVPLDRIRIVGVILGKERSALARISKESGQDSGGLSEEEESSPVITVKEGMELGLNGGQVRAILPGGIVVVEKIRNVYDQDEYLETIIPISE